MDKEKPTTKPSNRIRTRSIRRSREEKPVKSLELLPERKRKRRKTITDREETSEADRGTSTSAREAETVEPQTAMKTTEPTIRLAESLTKDDVDEKGLASSVAEEGKDGSYKAPEEGGRRVLKSPIDESFNVGQRAKRNLNLPWAPGKRTLATQRIAQHAEQITRGSPKSKDDSVDLSSVVTVSDESDSNDDGEDVSIVTSGNEREEEKRNKEEEVIEIAEDDEDTPPVNLNSAENARNASIITETEPRGRDECDDDDDDDDDDSSRDSRKLIIDFSDVKSENVSCSSNSAPASPAHKRSRQNSQSSKCGIEFAVGNRLEARDYLDKWYAAKIVKADWQKREVFIHFDGWNTRYDEWITMDSPRLRPVTMSLRTNDNNKKLPKQDYKIGEIILAKWSDCKMYPAKISKIHDNGTFEVIYEDGFEKIVQSINVRKMPSNYDKKAEPRRLPEENPYAKKIPKKGCYEDEDSLSPKNSSSSSCQSSSSKAASPGGGVGGTGGGGGTGVGSSTPKESKKANKRSSSVLLVGGIFRAKRPQSLMQPDKPVVSKKQSQLSLSAKSVKQSKKVLLKMKQDNLKICSQKPNLEDEKRVDAPVNQLDSTLDVSTDNDEAPSIITNTPPTPSDLNSNESLASYAKAGTPLGVAPKEFIIEEDHNHFKCGIEGCGRSFRKAVLLTSHMKHYHNNKNGTPAPSTAVTPRRTSIHHGRKVAEPPVAASTLNQIEISTIKKEVVDEVTAEDEEKESKSIITSPPPPPETPTSTADSKVDSTPLMPQTPLDTICFPTAHSTLSSPQPPPHLLSPPPPSAIKSEPQSLVKPPPPAPLNKEGDLNRKMITETRRQILMQRKTEAVRRKRQEEEDRRTAASLKKMDAAVQKKRNVSGSSRVSDESSTTTAELNSGEGTVIPTAKKRRNKGGSRKMTESQDGGHPRRKKTNSDSKENVTLVSLLNSEPLDSPSYQAQPQQPSGGGGGSRSSNKKRRSTSLNEGSLVDQTGNLQDGVPQTENPTKGRAGSTRRKSAVPNNRALIDNVWNEEEREEVVNCICRLQEEDGLMMQCEICLAWQHGSCFNIEEEEKVPEHYVCFACTNPRGLRKSFKYKWDQDWYKRGNLPSFECVPSKPPTKKRRNLFVQTHNLTGHVSGVQNVLRGLRHKCNILTMTNHPKLILWKKPWNSEEMESPCAFGDHSYSVQTPGSCPSAEGEHPSTSTTAVSDGDRGSTNGDSVSTLMSTPTAGDPRPVCSPIVINARDSQKESSMEEISKINRNRNDPGPQINNDDTTKSPAKKSSGLVIDIRPQKVQGGLVVEDINFEECRSNLIDHIDKTQDEVDRRLEELEQHLEALEAKCSYCEIGNDSSVLDMTHLKRLMKGLLTDLEKVQRISLYCDREEN